MTAFCIAPFKKLALPFRTIRQVLVLSDFLIRPPTPLAIGGGTEVSMLSKLFRSTPKWQNIKSQKRIEAIQELRPELESDIEILTRLAKEDSEPAVRREAVGKLHDFDILSQIQKRDLEAVVRDAAGARLHALMAGKSPFSPSVEERLQRLERINAPQVLVALIREAEPMEIRLAAVAALNDDMYLQDIAMHSQVARLRQAAAERITTPALLEELLEASRQKDKTVYRIAKGRLDEQHAVLKAERERESRAVALCESMEAHARGALNPLYSAKTESLRQQWAELGIADPVLVERFATAHGLACRQVADVIAAEQRAADEAQARQELQGAIETLEATAREYQGQDDFDLPALAAVRKTQRLRWELASGLHPVADAMAARYHQALASLDTLETQLVRWQEDKPTVEALLDSHKAGLPVQGDVVASLMAAYRASGLPLPRLLSSLAESTCVSAAPEGVIASGNKTDNRELKGELLRQLDDIESSIKAGNSREASRRWKHAIDFAKQHHLHHQRLQLVGEQVRELKSWAGFAVVPKKEALLASMQTLAGLDIDPEDKADRIKALQDEWKSLGVADPATEQPLWEQFKVASDAAFEPCRQHFAAQREMRATNLEKRIGLCQQLEQYASSLPANIDWKNHDAIIRTARHEWQSYTPVDRQPGRPAQERFDAVIRQLESVRDAHWEQVASGKQALVNKAILLMEEPDLRLACDQAKALQLEWKTLGSGSPRSDSKQWKAFRAASDAIFGRREEEFRARKEAKEGMLQRAETLTVEMEALAGKLDAASRADVTRMESAFRELELGRESQALRERFQKARHAVVHAMDEKIRLQAARAARSAIDAWISVCAVEQAFMQQGLPLPPELSTLPSPWKAPLQARLTAASAEAVADWNAIIDENSQRVLDALMDLEIALDIPSPVTRESERRARQLALLQQSGLRGGHTGDNEKKLQQLLATGPVNAAIVRETASRLEAIAARL